MSCAMSVGAAPTDSTATSVSYNSHNSYSTDKEAPTMSSVRRLLPINSNKEPGGEEDPKAPPKAPPNEEVPQESSDEEEESSDNEEESSDGYDDDDDDEEDDDPMLWTKETLVRGIKFAHKKYLKLSNRYERLQEQIEKLTTDATNLKVKHQVSITSKNTAISNLKNQLKIQSESKSAVRQEYKNKYQEEIDSWKQKTSYHRKRSQDLLRDLTKTEKEAKQFCTEKEIARRKLSKVNLDYVEKNKEVSLLKSENKRLKKDLSKKVVALEKIDQTKIQAKIQIEKEKTERTRVLEAEKTARMLMEQQAKDIDHQKKKELAMHNSELRIQEKAKVRMKKDEEDKEKLKEQNKRLDSHLATIMRSVPAARTSLPNNGQFPGMNDFVQHQLQPANNLPSMLLRLGGSVNGSGSSNTDDAISLVTQPPAASPQVASPPARQLTLTQMARERTPERTPEQSLLPRGVQKLTDEASGETYYMISRNGSKNFYMSYDEMIEAVGNEKTGESTAPRRQIEANSGSTAANVTPATTFDSQMSDLTMTQQTQTQQQSPWSHQSLDSAACQSDTEEEEEEEF